MTGADGGASVDPTTLTALVAVGALLLVPAGVAKLRQPQIARSALGWAPRTGDAGIRVIGVGELLLAAAALALPGPGPLVALAGAYLGFAVVAGRQRARGAGCGCFGTASETVTSRTHVVVNVLAAAAVLMAAGTGAPTAVSLLLASPWPAAALMITGVVVAVASLRALLTVLPELAAARALTGSAVP